jgi:hypothetical protein
MLQIMLIVVLYASRITGTNDSLNGEYSGREKKSQMYLGVS